MTLKPGEIGILLAVAGIGLLMYTNTKREDFSDIHPEDVFIGGLYGFFDQGAQKTQSAGQFKYKSNYPSQTGSKSTPASRSKSTGGGVGGPDTKAKYDKAKREQAARNAAIIKKNKIIVQQWRVHLAKLVNAYIAKLNIYRRSRGLKPIIIRKTGYQPTGALIGGLGGGIDFNDIPAANAQRLASTVTNNPQNRTQLEQAEAARLAVEAIQKQTGGSTLSGQQKAILTQGLA